MLFNQMSNSTGLRYTSQPLNHCLKNMHSHTCANMLIHTSKTKHMPNAFAKRAEIWAQCWVSPETAFSLLFVCVCVLMCEVKRKEKKSSLHVLFMCLSFICCLWYISLETFSHFKSSLAISEIIGLVLSRLHVQYFSFFSFFFLSPHATKLPNLKLCLSFFYCWQCVNMFMSATLGIKRFCVNDWALTLVWCHTRYVTKKYNQIHGQSLCYTIGCVAT